MRKTVLMLILCAPLFWTALQEGRRFYEAWTWSRTPPSKSDDPEHAKTAAELKRIKKEVDAIVEMPDSVAATIVGLDRKPADFGKGRLEKAVLDHVTKREQGSREDRAGADRCRQDRERHRGRARTLASERPADEPAR